MTCEDEDECLDGSAVCDEDATCSNNDGSYDCTCNEGYTGDGFKCSDINECKEGNHNCDSNAKCANTIGGVECTCRNGFERTAQL